MTDIAFHFNVPDTLAYACRLLRKAYLAGGPVGVVGPHDSLAALDRQLWEFSALDFVPHCRAGAPASVRLASPIVLAQTCDELSETGVLVHIGETVPPGFERFGRLIELVGQEAAERELARARWRHYADRGYAIRRHDVAVKE